MKETNKRTVTVTCLGIMSNEEVLNSFAEIVAKMICKKRKRGERNENSEL